MAAWESLPSFVWWIQPLLLRILDALSEEVKLCLQFVDHSENAACLVLIAGLRLPVSLARLWSLSLHKLLLLILLLYLVLLPISVVLFCLPHLIIMIIIIMYYKS